MAKVLIVYHCNTGNTEEMANAVLEGAKSVSGIEVVVKRAFEATFDDLVGCDAVAFGSPVNLGYMTGALKDFFDRTYHGWRKAAVGKPFVTFGSSGGGGRKALDSIEGICNAHFQKLGKLTEGVVTAGKPAPEVLNQCRELGKKLAAAVLG